jgi:outer membrane lipoprotein-sorting protein
MKALLIAALVCTGAAVAQDAKPAGLTAEQIIEKSIEASGGREAMAKIKSTAIKAEVDVTFAGMKATAEIYSKEPNKRLMVQNIDGFGQIRQGFDGTNGWADDPQGGLRDMAGEELEQMKIQAEMHGELKWRELYPKVEVKGKEKVGDREVYVLALTNKAGKTTTQSYDAENFQVLRQVTTAVTPQGEMEIKTELSDYRMTDGVRMPFQLKQSMPMGDIVIKFIDVKHNVDIEDAKFAKPSK